MKNKSEDPKKWNDFKTWVMGIAAALIVAAVIALAQSTTKAPSLADFLPKEAKGITEEEVQFMRSIPPSTAFPIDAQLEDFITRLRIAKRLESLGLFLVVEDNARKPEAIRQYQYAVLPTALGNAVNEAIRKYDAGHK